MRLVLASSEPGPAIADELVRLAGPGARVAIALDAVEDPDPERFERERHALGTAGEGAARADLGDLHEIDVLWVVGGNWHALWRSMAPVAQELAARVHAGSLLYGGWSAGAVAAGPLIVENGAPAWGGLGLVALTVVPHHGSDEGLDQVAAHLRAAGERYVALRDGQALVIDGATTALIG